MARGKRSIPFFFKNAQIRTANAENQAWNKGRSTTAAKITAIDSKMPSPAKSKGYIAVKKEKAHI